ncbi:MAG: hypothetical protein KAR20_11475, partial [Candidatus Heimdallarchaeota archaeon]|nr:hypothetical protein [Candidatus Heimdallarchaeota archaeon]
GKGRVMQSHMEAVLRKPKEPTPQKSEVPPTPQLIAPQPRNLLRTPNPQTAPLKNDEVSPIVLENNEVVLFCRSDDENHKVKTLTERNVNLIIATSYGTASYSVKQVIELIKAGVKDAKDNEIIFAIEEARNKPGKINAIDKYLCQIIRNKRVEENRKKIKAVKNGKSNKPSNTDKPTYFKWCDRECREVEVPIPS